VSPAKRFLARTQAAISQSITSVNAVTPTHGYLTLLTAFVDVTPDGETSYPSEFIIIKPSGQLALSERAVA
jgi:hypothetical protein